MILRVLTDLATGIGFLVLGLLAFLCLCLFVGFVLASADDRG